MAKRQSDNAIWFRAVWADGAFCWHLRDRDFPAAAGKTLCGLQLVSFWPGRACAAFAPGFELDSREAVRGPAMLELVNVCERCAAEHGRRKAELTPDGHRAGPKGGPR